MFFNVPRGQRPRPTFNSQGTTVAIEHAKPTPRNHTFGGSLSCARCVQIDQERRLAHHVRGRLGLLPMHLTWRP